MPFSALIKHTQTSTLTLDTLGVALSRVGLHQLALSYFQRAVALTQTKASYFYNLGVSLKFTGDFVSAKHAFEQALQLEPDYYQAHYALSDLAMTEDATARIAQLHQVKAGSVQQTLCCI